MLRSFVIAAAMFGGVRLVPAQPAGAQAEMMFRRGKELLAKGQIAEACAAFDASQKLDPTDATLLNQASCRERNNQFATAWGLFLEAKRKTSTRIDPTSKQMNKTASERASKLESRLSTLTINVPEDAAVGGLEITRDREVLEPVMWNKALPLDGGVYRVTARAPGNTEWSTTITVANERDTKTVEIPKLRQAELAPRREPTPEVTTVSPPKPAPAPNRVVLESPTMPSSRREVDAPPPSSKLPYLVGTGSLVLLGTGLVFELHARSTYDSAKTETDPQRQLSLWDSANTQRHVAQGVAIAGVAAAGVATFLFVRHRSNRTMTATVSRDSAGLVVMGGF